MKTKNQLIVGLLFYFVFSLLMVSTGIGQTADGFNYQAVIREGDGSIRANDVALIRFTIAADSNGTNSFYSEQATLNTDQYGLVNHVIGTGTNTSGSLAGINWSTGSKYLIIELNGNAGFEEVSDDKLQAVPFATFADQADYNSLLNRPSLFDGDYNSLTNKPSFSSNWTRSGNDIRSSNSGNVGVGTASPAEKFDVAGISRSLSFRLSRGGSNVIQEPYIRAAGSSNKGIGFFTLDNNNLPKMLINDGGNVGIGISSPTAPLHVIANNTTSPDQNGIYVYNQNNTGSSNAILATRVRSASSGDPFVSFDIDGVSGWSLGIDNSDADKLKIGSSWSNVASSTRLTIDRTGKFGFGSSSPNAFMDVLQPGFSSNDGIRLYRNTNNIWEIYHSSAFLSFANNGTRVAYIQNGTGSYTQVSDSTMKTEIEELGTILEKVNLLKPVSYRYKGKNGNSPKTYGFLAQEVGVVFPEMVKTAEDGSIGLAYSEFSIISIKAIQEQQIQIQEQQIQIEELKKELLQKSNSNETLEERLKTIEAKLIELSKVK